MAAFHRPVTRGLGETGTVRSSWPSWVVALGVLVVAAPVFGLPLVSNPLEETRSPPVNVPNDSRPPSRPASLEDDDAEYSIEFVCPDGFEDGSSNQRIVHVGCPYRILDDSDALGSPSIVVNPFNPDEVAISSLHGGGEVEGPTPRSREVGTTGAGLFTVFTSDDGGYNWQDKPSQSFKPPTRERETYGEHVAVAMDADGRLYGAGSFSMRGNDTEPFGSRIVAWKWGTVDDDVRWGQAFLEIDPVGWPSWSDWVSIAYLPSPESLYYDPPPYESPSNQNPWANQTVTPSPTPTGNDTSEYNPYEEAVVAVWLERALDPDNASLAGKTSRLRAAWTGVYNTNHWEELALNMTIGPCSSISNAVAWDEGVYVACVVGDADEYNHRHRAKTGDIDIWKIVPKDGHAELVDATPLTGGNPRLAVSSHGRFVLATLERMSSSELRAEIGFSWFGEGWASGDITGLFATTGATDIVDARIQTMVYMRDSKTIHFIYNEVYPPVGFNLTDPKPPHVAQFNKQLIAFSECNGLEVRQPLIDGLVHQYSPVVEAGADFSLFDDLVDGLVVIPTPEGKQREFIAYGDMGVVNFAEIREHNPPVCDFIGGLPPPPQPPAVPLELGSTLQASSSTAQQAALGVGGGVITAAMLARLYAAKKSHAVNAPAGAGKK